MILTNENYFSLEANKHYMSVSQFKTFDECEARGLAEVVGDYIRPNTTSLLIGSYVDASFEGSLDLFKAKNPEIFTKQGLLKSEYRKAEQIINRISHDELFMNFLDGKKQVIKTGEIVGFPVKIKIDVLHLKSIVDLKIVKDFNPIWKNGQKMNFIEAWGYDLQGAVYQEVTGGKLPFIIAGATKENEPDMALISIPQSYLDERLSYFKSKIRHFDNIKKGLEKPSRCETCDYCKATKVLDRLIDMREITYNF